MATPLKDGVSLIGSIIFNIIRNGIAGNEKNSDSESSSQSDELEFEEKSDVENKDDMTLTRKERIKLRRAKQNELTNELNCDGPNLNENGGINFGEASDQNVKSYKEMKKDQKRHIKKQIQKIQDEYGSEAYFCGSSCSECDTVNHKESEQGEIFEFQQNSAQENQEEEKEEVKEEQIQEAPSKKKPNQLSNSSFSMMQKKINESQKNSKKLEEVSKNQSKSGQKSEARKSLKRSISQLQADSHNEVQSFLSKSKKNSNTSGIQKPTVIPASRNWMDQELNRPSNSSSQKQSSEIHSIKSEQQISSKQKLEEVKEQPFIQIPSGSVNPFAKKPEEYVTHNPFLQSSTKKVERLCHNQDKDASQISKPPMPSFQMKKEQTNKSDAKPQTHSKTQKSEEDLKRQQEKIRNQYKNSFK